MRISRLIIEEKETQLLGLSTINISTKKLGNVVSLVGKNGAGKSRILSLISKNLLNLRKSHICEGQIINFPRALLPTDGIKQFEDSPIKVDALASKPALNASVTKLYTQLRPHIIRLVKVVNNQNITTIREHIDKAGNFESIINNITAVQDPLSVLNKEYVNEFDFVNSLSMVDYLNKLTNDLAVDQYSFYKKSQNNEPYDETSSKAYQNFEVLKKYITLFLEKDISYTDELNKNSRVLTSKLHLNDVPFDIKILSPGEKTLLAYAILFFVYEITGNTNPKDYIIIIDEPELHLHPGAQLKLIDALRNLIKDSGQLWIATHSLAIISHLNYNEILLVKDNTILPPSTGNLEKVFRELMIVDEHRHELSSFITSLSDWAHARFIKQCFLDPDVIKGLNKNDPQYQVFKKFIQDKDDVKLLDFGAGYGRVGALLSEDVDTENKVDYSVYEPNSKLADVLRQQSFVSGCYNDINKIKKGHFDVVLLCNVLHEISPLEWIQTMNQIKSLLKPDGYLFIIEDLLLPKGENANDFGYILLDNKYLDELMGFEGKSFSIQLKHEDDRYKDRLVFYVVNKEYIKTDITCVWNSVASLHDDLFEKIKVLRTSNSIADARIYANYCQQYINTKLAVEKLDKLKDAELNTQRS